MATIPANFDVARFIKKFDVVDFWDDGHGNLVCPLRPEITDANLLDCIFTTEELQAQAEKANTVIFDRPVVAPVISAGQFVEAPEFIVHSPKPKTDPIEALVQASALAVSEGKPLAEILLNLVVVILDMDKRLKKAKV